MPRLFGNNYSNIGTTENPIYRPNVFRSATSGSTLDGGETVIGTISAFGVSNGYNIYSSRKNSTHPHIFQIQSSNFSSGYYRSWEGPKFKNISDQAFICTAFQAADDNVIFRIDSSGTAHSLSATVVVVNPGSQIGISWFTDSNAKGDNGSVQRGCLAFFSSYNNMTPEELISGGYAYVASW